MAAPAGFRMGSICLLILAILLVGFASLGNSSRFPASLRLPLQHTHASNSPLRPVFRSRAEEIRHLLQRDADRIGFTSSRRILARGEGSGAGLQSQHGDTKQPEAAGAASMHRPLNLQSEIIPGSSYGTGSYLVDFQVGTPPKKLSLILDTGSDLVWTQCQPCVGCYKEMDPVFEPGLSSSYANVSCNAQQCFLVPAPAGKLMCDDVNQQPCQYFYQYGDGSTTSGLLASETVTLKSANVKGVAEDVKIPGVIFGCGNSNAGSFGMADGVLGLGQGPLSFPKQIAAPYGTKFSYCLMDFREPTTTRSFIMFGEHSDRILEHKASVDKHRVQYTKLVENKSAPTEYYVGIVDVSVAGKKVPISPAAFAINSTDGSGGTFFDSGVTITYFVTEAYNAIISALEEVIDYPGYNQTIVPPLTLCFEAHGNLGSLKLPLLILELKGGAVFVPQESNLYVEVEFGIKCLAIADAGPSGTNVLGNLIQQNFLMVHDSGRRRVGFAEADCAAL